MNFLGIHWDQVPIKGDPLIFGSQIAILLTSLGILVGVTYFKKWKWLWNEWFTSVDHKNVWDHVYPCRYNHVCSRRY